MARVQQQRLHTRSMTYIEVQTYVRKNTRYCADSLQSFFVVVVETFAKIFDILYNLLPSNLTKLTNILLLCVFSQAIVALNGLSLTCARKLSRYFLAEQEEEERRKGLDVGFRSLTLSWLRNLLPTANFTIVLQFSRGKARQKFDGGVV